MSDWGVALARPNMERTALVNLARQGYESYAPRIQDLTARRVNGQLVKVRQEQFLFGRYFFVRIMDTWRSITGTKGISQLLMNNDKPVLLHAHEISKLKSREVNGLVRLPRRVALNNALSDGASVRVSEGVFSGFKGVCSGMTLQERVVVLLNIAGRSVRVKIAATDLELIKV